MSKPKVRLGTPLVIGTVIVVVALAIAKMFLTPERLGTWIMVVLLVPMTMGILRWATRRVSSRERAVRLGGRLRAGLVGAGVMLATALGFSITDSLGLTGGEEPGGRTFVLTLPAVIAALIEFLGTRLEHHASKDPDETRDS